MAFKYLPLILASRWNIYSLTFMLYKDDVLAHNGFTKKKKKASQQQVLQMHTHLHTNTCCPSGETRRSRQFHRSCCSWPHTHLPLEHQTLE
uniref:Putative secreted protein n=1 Tax=Ixodes ricinus TaxID=34613 RepID=A0A6B0UCB1_IXORI